MRTQVEVKGSVNRIRFSVVLFVPHKPQPGIADAQAALRIVEKIYSEKIYGERNCREKRS